MCPKFSENRQNEICFMAQGNSRFVLRAFREITDSATSLMRKLKKNKTFMRKWGFFCIKLHWNEYIKKTLKNHHPIDASQYWTDGLFFIHSLFHNSLQCFCTWHGPITYTMLQNNWNHSEKCFFPRKATLAIHNNFKHLWVIPKKSQWNTKEKNYTKPHSKCHPESIYIKAQRVKYSRNLFGMRQSLEGMQTRDDRKKNWKWK